MRTINRRNQRKQEQPAGARHTTTEWELRHSHFADGEPHFLLRPPVLFSRNKRGLDECGIQRWDALRLFFDLFRQVVLQPNLLDRFQLRFDPIDMLVHIFGHILEHVPRGEVGHLRTMHHAIA